MALSLSNVSARELLRRTREKVKPWGDFIDTKRFQLPTNLAPLPRRIISNIDHFQGNYLFVFLGLLIFCILTSPVLLVAIGVCLGACYFISTRDPNDALVVMDSAVPCVLHPKFAGHQVSVSHQYMAVAALSFPLFWLAGAGSAVFWIIGASFFVIMLHASTYSTEDELEGYDLEMDSIETMS